MDYIECVCGGLNQECSICGGQGFLPTNEKKSSAILTEDDMRKSIITKLVAASSKIPEEVLNTITNGTSIASFYFNGAYQELEELLRKINEAYHSLRYFRLCHRLLNENPGLLSHNAWHDRLSKMNLTEESSLEKAKKYSEQIKSQIQDFKTISENLAVTKTPPVIEDHMFTFNNFWNQLFPETVFENTFLKESVIKKVPSFFELFNKEVVDIKFGILFRQRLIGKRKINVDLQILRKKLLKKLFPKYLTQSTLYELKKRYNPVPNRGRN